MSRVEPYRRQRRSAWVFLDRYCADGFTILWCRDESVAYVLKGKRIGDHATVAVVLATIPMSPTGWTDLAKIRLVGGRWVRQR